MNRIWLRYQDIMNRKGKVLGYNNRNGQVLGYNNRIGKVLGYYNRIGNLRDGNQDKTNRIGKVLGYNEQDRVGKLVYSKQDREGTRI